MKLAAYRNRRIEDMDRAELIDTINHLYRCYIQIARLNMTESRLPDFNEDPEKWNKILDQWFTPEGKSDSVPPSTVA